MNEKLEDFFIEQGFKKLMEFVPGFAVYFIMENRYANAVCLIDHLYQRPGFPSICRGYDRCRRWLLRLFFGQFPEIAKNAGTAQRRGCLSDAAAGECFRGFVRNS